MGEGRFSPAETKLLDAVNRGRIADYRSGIAAEQPGPRGDERTISADAIRAILTGTIPALCPTSAGIRIAGARIAGELRLASLKVSYPLEFLQCQFEDPINLNGAELNSLSLAGSRIGRMDAGALEISSGISLSQGFTSEEIDLRRAHIGGDLSCIDSKFEGGQLAINSEGAAIDGHLLLSNGLSISGQVNLTNAKVGGLLYCAHSLIENRGSKALILDSARFAAGVIMSNGFKVRGEVSAAGAVINRILYCSNCSLDNSGAAAFAADAVVIGGDVWLANWFYAKGTVRMCDAEIRGNLHCVGGAFDNAEGSALMLDRSRIDGSIHVHTRFIANGAVQMDRISLAGSMVGSGGCFQNSRGVAVSLRDARIKGRVALNNGFRARGAVVLDGSEMSELICSEGKFENPRGIALSLNNALVTGNVLLNEGFHSLGAVLLENTNIGGAVDRTDGVFELADEGFISSAFGPLGSRK